MSNGLRSGTAVMDAGPFHRDESPAVDDRATHAELIRRICDLDGVVEGLLAEWIGGRALLHGRRSHRVISRRFFSLTPVCEQTLQPAGATCRVQAYDLSPDGVSFTHRGTLPYRFVAATFQPAAGDPQTVLTRLKWCRFTRKQEYRSGGQFVRIIRPDWETEFTLDLLPAG